MTDVTELQWRFDPSMHSTERLMDALKDAGSSTLHRVRQDGATL